MLFAFNQLSASKYAPHLKKGGIFIYDTTFVTDPPVVEGKVYHLPITRMAREKVGREIVANIVALGAIVAITGSCRESPSRPRCWGGCPRAPRRSTKALKLGFEAVEGLVATGTASA